MTKGGTYDFTSSAGQTYGNGSTVNLGDGVYGSYSGDNNQDGVIDAADLVLIKSSLGSFIVGSYDGKDLNGDGNVDINDLRIIRNIAQAGITVQHP